MAFWLYYSAVRHWPREVRINGICKGGVLDNASGLDGGHAEASPVFAYVSDLHADVSKCSLPPLGCADALLVAGDMGADMGRAREVLAGAGIPVFAVLGNHDYWSQGAVPMDLMLERWREAFAGTEVRILEKEAVCFKGVWIFGTTLWTDFGGLNSRMAYCAQSSMSDFSQIARCSSYSQEDLELLERMREMMGTQSFWSAPGGAPRALPEHLALEHYKSKAWLEQSFAQAQGRPSVALTHHAPSLQSLREFGLPQGRLEMAFSEALPAKDPAAYRRAAYASDAGLIEGSGLSAWIHGHLHKKMGYARSGVWVACNPRGYTDRECEGFLAKAETIEPARPCALESSEARIAPLLEGMGRAADEYGAFEAELAQARGLLRSACMESMAARAQKYCELCEGLWCSLRHAMDPKVFGAVYGAFLWPCKRDAKGNWIAQGDGAGLAELMRAGLWMARRAPRIALEISGRAQGPSAFGALGKFLAVKPRRDGKRMRTWVAYRDMPEELREAFREHGARNPWARKQVQGDPESEGLIAEEALRRWMELAGGFGSLDGGCWIDSSEFFGPQERD